MVVSESGQGVHWQGDEGEQVLPLIQIVYVIWKWIWIIVLAAMVTVAATAGASLMEVPTYESTIKILVGQKQEEGSPSGASNLGSNVEGLQQLTKTLTEAVRSRPVAEAVIKRLNLGVTPEDFLKNLQVQQIPETQFIQVTYRDSSPRNAQLVANTTGEVASELISQVSPDANAVTAKVWQTAEVPDSPVSPNLRLNILLALVVGVVFGLGLAFLLEYFDGGSRWKRQNEALESKKKGEQ